MIDTAVIPAAGLGTRLFTMTKESPKEMVPVFFKDKNKRMLVKPLVEIIFENLFDEGFRNFCIIVGRGKESIENHLSPHYDFIELLEKKGESTYAKILVNFYKKIEKSSIVWIRQHKHKGIGPATLLAKEVIGSRTFLFHAGDLYIPNKNYLYDMKKIHKKDSPIATIGLKEVKDDPRRYGLAKIKEIGKNKCEILKTIEKPKKPISNYALTGVNIFEGEIFNAISKTKPGVNNEIQLTDAIQTLVSRKHKVLGSFMRKNNPCIDIGVPETYYDALKYSFSHRMN